MPGLGYGCRADILIGFFSHVVLFGTGWIASRLFGGHRPANIEDLVYWSTRRQEPNT